MAQAVFDETKCYRIGAGTARPRHVPFSHEVPGTSRPHAYFVQFPESASADKGVRAPVLIIGYGNTLRSDDGVGPAVADAIEKLGFPNLEAISCPQLTPELCDPISRSRLVIFVDAALDGTQQVELRKISPSSSSQIMAHAADPGTMLALARDVFGHAPEAWLIAIPVENLGLGEELSQRAQAGVKQAINKIKALLKAHAKVAKNAKDRKEHRG